MMNERKVTQALMLVVVVFSATAIVLLLRSRFNGEPPRDVSVPTAAASVETTTPAATPPTARPPVDKRAAQPTPDPPRGAASTNQNTTPTPTPTEPAPPSAPPVVRSDCSPSPSELRTLAANVFAEHADPTEFAKALDVAVGMDPNATVLQRGAVISHSDDLMVLALFPYDTFRTSLLEALRKKEPIGAGIVPIGVRIVVSPSRIDAPDIEKIIVERDGHTVPPLASSLRSTELATRMGAKRMIHAGEVTYPCSAFAPDGVVVVTAIPAIGQNLVKVMQPEELRTLK